MNKLKISIITIAYNCEKEIIKVLDALCDKFGIAIDWTSQNVMPYLTDLGSRLVKYEVIYNSDEMILWLVMTIGFVLLTVKGVKNEDKLYEMDLEWLSGIGVIASGICILITIVIIFCNSSDIITALTIPEKIILEELQSLMGT